MSDTATLASTLAPYIGAESTKNTIDIALALLDWPFLLFVGISVFIWIFKDSVTALLGRGDIQISWGENRHIKLTEISDGIDEELDPLKEEVQLLKDKIDALELLNAGDSENLQKSASSTEEGLSNDAKEIARQRLVSELINGKYRWRSIEALSKKAAISEQDTLDILRASMSEIILSRSKSESTIARHISR